MPLPSLLATITIFLLNLVYCRLMETEKQAPAAAPKMPEEVILTFADDLGSEMVDICAGLNPDRSAEKTFTIHRDLLFTKCDYLRKNVQVVSVGLGKRLAVNFPMEDAGTVSLLVNYLYKDSVPTVEEYIANKKAREFVNSGGLPIPSFSVLRQPRPVAFGQNSPMAFGQPENKPLSPFGSFGNAAQFGVAAPFPGPATFGALTTPRPPLLKFGSSPATPTRPVEAKSQQHEATIELYQITLLHLCMLAERIHWPALFNAAIRSYSQGESLAGRSTSIEHARLIYNKSTTTSTLRDMILDGMYNLGEDGLEKCMAFASEDKNFFRALCTRSLRPKQEFDSVMEALNNGAYDLVEKERASVVATAFGSFGGAQTASFGGAPSTTSGIVTSPESSTAAENGSVASSKMEE